MNTGYLSKANKRIAKHTRSIKGKDNIFAIDIIFLKIEKSNKYSKKGKDSYP